jgi:hypothetical protein
MDTIQKRLDRVISFLDSESILNKKGHGNEIRFYIFDYDPRDELYIRDFVNFITQKYATNKTNLHPIEIDLYDTAISIIHRKIPISKVIDYESKNGDKKLFDSLKPLLKPETIIAAIQEKLTPEINLLLMTGIGKSWPLLRSHVILNNLHEAFSDLPLILFFPGRFDGSQLVLFNTIKDDHYYRAFRLEPWIGND